MDRSYGGGRPLGGGAGGNRIRWTGGPMEPAVMPSHNGYHDGGGGAGGGGGLMRWQLGTHQRRRW